MPPTAIVTCADRAIFPLLVGLLRSLGPLDRARYRVCVLDIGLTEGQREVVAALSDSVEPVREDLLVQPHPQIAEALREKLPFWRAQLCRPYLRDYFPGHRHYVHIDADIWAQGLGVFDAAIAEVEAGKVVIVPEADVTYPFLLSHTANAEYAADRTRLIRGYFGDDIAELAGALPHYNTGFFALAADAPHWEVFRDYLAGITRSAFHFLSEQIAFNIVLFQFRNVCLFPATCNWMCYMAPPVRGADGLWRSPVYPHPVIDLLHLSGTDKLNRYHARGLLQDDGAYLDSIRHLID